MAWLTNWTSVATNPLNTKPSKKRTAERRFFFKWLYVHMRIWRGRPGDYELFVNNAKSS